MKSTFPLTLCVTFVLAAIFSSIHYLMQTMLGASPFVFVGTTAQIALALCVLLSPRHAELLVKSAAAIAGAAVLFIIGTGMLLWLPTDSALLWGAVALIGVIDQLYLIITGVVLADLPESDRYIASFCGMGASFFLSVIAFSLPTELSFAFQMGLFGFASFLCVKLLRASQAVAAQPESPLPSMRRRSPSEDPSANTAPTKPEGTSLLRQIRQVPWKYVSLCTIFSAGFHYMRAGGMPPANLAITFAIPAACSLFLVTAEIRYSRSRLFPFTEIIIGACLAVPLLYYGSGFTSNSISLAIQSCSLLGYFLVTPCYYLLLLNFAEESHENPFRIFAAMYIANSLGQFLSGAIVFAEELANEPIVNFTVAVVLALAAFFCALVPMSESIKSTLWAWMSVESTPPSDPKPESSLIVERLEASCQKLAKQYGLTRRETEILVLLARRWTMQLISETLHLSINTTKTHVLHIHQKLDVHSHKELFALIEMADES